MLRQPIVDNLDIFSEIIGKEIKVVGSYYVVDGLYFTNFKRLVAYTGKTFEVEDAIKNNTILKKVKRAYKNEKEPEYPNFEWATLKSRYFTDENIHYDKQGYPIASRAFSITSSWGEIEITRWNKLVSLFTIDGLETGMIILRRTVAPKVFAPTLDYLRPINFTPDKPVGWLLGNLSSRTALTARPNIFTIDMIPSLLTMCKAGMIMQIKAHKPTTKKLAVAMSQDKELLSVPYLSINKKSTIDFIAENIVDFSNKETDFCISNVVNACYTIGRKIPKAITDVLATRSNMSASVSEETRQFVFNIMESFFTVVKTSYIAVNEKYGDKSYIYKGKDDAQTARTIADKISKIDTVSKILAKTQKRDIVALIHEYLNQDFPVSEVKNDSYSIGKLSMTIDYDYDRIIFANTTKKALQEPEKWLIDAQLHHNCNIVKHRPKILKAIFANPESEINAIRATYMLAIASMLDIECTIKIYGQTKYDHNAGMAFFNCPSFNILNLKIKSPKTDRIRKNDIGFFTEADAKDFMDVKRKIILVNNPKDADIHLKSKASSQSDRISVYRLPKRRVEKRYIVFFYRTLELLAKTFVSKEHAADYLSDPDKMKRFSKSFTV